MKEQLGGIFNEYVMYRNNKFSSNKDFSPIKTEKVILSPKFLTQRVFNDVDRENMIPIIREYKLNAISI